MGGGHGLRVKSFVQFFLCHQAMLEHEVVHATACLEGFLRDLGGGLVADVRVQGRDNADGVLHHLVAVLDIDSDAVDALGAEGFHYVDQPGLALEDALDDDGLHHVQLQLAGLGGEGDGGVVADDLEAHLVRDLGDDGIHLARHDGGTRRHGRQVDLVQAAAGAGGHEAQVVTDLGKLDGEAFQRRGITHIRAGVRRRFHEVRSLLELVACELGKADGAQFRETGNGVEAGADGSAAHIDLLQEHGVPLKVRDFLFEVVRERVEFLSGGHRNGVLQLGAAHLDNVLEFLPLGAEGVDEVLEGLLEMPVHPDEGVAEGARESVIRGLGTVHMVVRGAVLILALVMAQDLEGAVRNDLVGIHVHRGAGATLHHVHGELVVEFAIDNLLTGLDDGVRDGAVEHAQFGIGLGGGHFHIGDRDDVLGIVVHPRRGDLVVVECALSLDAVVGVGGYLEFAQEIAFYPEFGF